jgi:hypothetical protein
MEKLNAVMSTPAYLRSAARGALCALRVAISRFRGPTMTRIGMAIFVAMSAAACSDVTAPGHRMDRDAVENILPAVTDARRRVASGIADVAVRQEMTITLSNVEIALRSDDVESVEKGLTSVANLMSAYGNRASADRPEVSAVFLVLSGVQRISSPNPTVVISP